MGWGEFEASIRIVWRDEAEERPVLLTHALKLYPNNAPATLSVDPSTYMNTTVPVVSEKYDEVVFTNPKIAFHKHLLEGGGGGAHHHQQQQKKKKKLAYPLSHEPSVLEHFRTYGDETDVKAMLAAKEFLQKELRSVKDRLIKVDDELEEVKGMLSATTATSATTAGTTDGGGTKEGGASAAAAARMGGSSSSKSSKKKKTAAGGGSGEPASKKAKSS